MEKFLTKLLEKLLAKPLRKLARHIEKLGAQSSYPVSTQEKEADGPGTDVESESSSSATSAHVDSGEPLAKPWRECKYSSNWSGTEASRRMMNLVSPKFSDAKAKEYIDWQQSLGCDHVHLLLVNQGDGEGAGYDCLADAGHKAVALARVRDIRARGLGVVAWVVADDSDAYRRKIFDNPAMYADALKEYFPHLSYIVLGLEMNEGEGSKSKWTALRDAIRKAGWTGPFATHHTSGHGDYASLGQIVMDQLDKGCTEAQVRKSVESFRAKGYDVCGFEYARGPDKARTKAALEAGAFSVGNWAGGSTTNPETKNQEPGTKNQEPASADAVDYTLLDWRWGRFDGRKAVRAAGAEIGSLKVTANGLSYKWLSGGCEDLDRSCTHANPCCTCALFCLVGGKWVGGKFEHISSDRTSRGLGNVQEGYGGWDPSTLSKAEKYAFVILDDGAKRRTNVISCGR